MWYFVIMTRRDGNISEFGPFRTQQSAETFIIKHQYGPEYLSGTARRLQNPQEA